MALPAFDNFAGTGALSVSWTTQLGAPDRNADLWRPASAGANNASYWNGDTFPNDQFSQCLIAVSNDGGPTVRASGIGGATSFYMFDVRPAAGGGVGANIQKCVAGAFTQLTAFPFYLESGITAKLDAVGTTITAYSNGVSQGSTTDASLASGSAGLYSYNDIGRYDDFYADAVGQPTLRRGGGIPGMNYTGRGRW